MKITGLETVNVDAYPQITFVLVHTDEGIVGLGDTFFGSASVQTYVHEVAAPLLLGQDPLAIESLWSSLFANTVRGGLSMRSAEVRGLSAIDVALWDICAKAAGLPLYRLFGGPSPLHAAGLAT